MLSIKIFALSVICIQVNTVYGTDSLISKHVCKGNLHKGFHTILLCLAEVKEGSPFPLP